MKKVLFPDSVVAATRQPWRCFTVWTNLLVECYLFFWCLKPLETTRFWLLVWRMLIHILLLCSILLKVKTWKHYRNMQDVVSVDVIFHAEFSFRREFCSCGQRCVFLLSHVSLQLHQGWIKQKNLTDYTSGRWNPIASYMYLTWSICHLYSKIRQKTLKQYTQALQKLLHIAWYHGVTARCVQWEQLVE